MYYKLKDNIRLRGHYQMPLGVGRDDRELVPVSKAEFAALDLCDGATDLDFPLIPQRLRQIIPVLLEKDLIEPCEKGDVIRDDQRYRRFPNRLVKSIQWSITGSCNYRCRHCFMEAPHAKHGDLSTEELLDIADQMAACGILEVSLTGGEPLIRNDFIQIAERIVQNGMKLTQIYTNGMLVTPELLDALDAMGAHPHFCISFDGVGWHDWLRGVPGAEAVVERAIRLLTERGFTASCQMALHRGNLERFVESCQTLAEWGAQSLKVAGLDELGEWERGNANGIDDYGENMALTDDELWQFYFDVLPEYLEAGMPLEQLQLEGFFVVRPDAPEQPVRCITLRSYDDPEQQFCCLSARMNNYISSEGRVLPCMLMSEVGGFLQTFPTIAEMPLSQILTESPHMELADAKLSRVLEANPECAACEHFSVCGGGCRAQALVEDNAKYFGIDPKRCRMYKEGWSDRAVALTAKMNARYGTAPSEAAGAEKAVPAVELLDC